MEDSRVPKATAQNDRDKPGTEQHIFPDEQLLVVAIPGLVERLYCLGTQYLFEDLWRGRML